MANSKAPKTKGKLTVNQILLGQDWGSAIDTLSSSGHDVSIVVIGINKDGQVRIADNINDNLKVLGVLQISLANIMDRIEKPEGGL